MARNLRATQYDAATLPFHYIEPMRIGWESVRAGKPFNPDAFAGQFDQTNYEMSRLRAANVQAAGLALPPWPFMGPPPPPVMEAFNRAYDMIGPSVPASILAEGKRVRWAEIP